jgi:hypothetical protein
MTLEPSHGPVSLETDVILRHVAPIRAQLALCSLFAIVLGLFFPTTSSPGNTLVLVALALLCGTLLDIPTDLPLRKILIYCVPIQICTSVGVFMWCSIYLFGGPQDPSLYISNIGLSLMTYPMLVVCCLARPATVDLFSNIWGFLLSAQKSQIDIGKPMKVLFAIGLAVLGIRETSLPDILLRSLQ